METNQKEPIFRRKGRVGLSLLELKKDVAEFIEVTDFGTFTTKDGREIPKFDVTNLKTGETQTLWIDGGMKGLLAQMGGPDKAVGKSFEIKFIGQTEFEDSEGETKRVNSYDLFEIDQNLE